MEKQKTLGEFITSVSGVDGSYPFISYGKNVLSYSEVLKMSLSMADSIKKRFPAKRGDRVLVILPLSAHMYITYFSLWLLGMIPVPLSIELPPEAIVELLKNGNIRGVVSFGDVYDSIDQEIKSGKFHISAGVNDFLSNSTKPPEEVRIHATSRKRKFAMEEMCYDGSYIEPDMDPFTDMGIGGIAWNKDGSFVITDYTINSILDSLGRMVELLPDRRNLPFFQAYDPVSPAEVLLSILYPAFRGHNCIPARIGNELEKMMKFYCRTDPAVFNIRTYSSYIWELIGKSYGEKISHMIETWHSPDGYEKIPEIRRSSIFTMLCVDRDVSPQYMLQRRKGSRSIPASENIRPENIPGDTVQTDVVEIDGIVEYLGKTIPLDLIQNHFRKRKKLRNIQFEVKDGKISTKNADLSDFRDELPSWIRSAFI